MKSLMRTSLCLLILSVTTGCWDRTEINDIAFVMATALDITEEGEIAGALQIASPSSGQGGAADGGSGRKEKYFIVSDVGKNPNEVIQKLQKKVSRRLYYAHRSVVFIGEAMAKRGINDILDVLGRDPQSRLRTFLMVVKGREAREVLQIHYPFEQVPAEAIKEMEIFQNNLGVTLRDYYMASASEGVNPVMSVIEPDVPAKGMKGKSNLFRLAGSAIFKDYKLIGFLDEKETDGLLWVTGKMKACRISSDLPEGIGNVGMIITQAKRNISTDIRGDKLLFKLRLQGKGSLYDNNSPLDVSQPNNLELVRHALEKSLEEQVRGFLSKVQKRYRTDVVGFGQQIYRNKPREWKALQKQWDAKFPETDVSIAVKLTISGSGMAGPQLQLKEKEIKK